LTAVSSKKRQPAIIYLALLAGALLLRLPSAHAAASLELYGTFHAMGVVITLGPIDDPDGDATANVEYRVSGSGAYQPGFPLSRISSTRFAGSLFWLAPGTPYDVRVTFSDPDGALHGVTVAGTTSTRAEITIPAPNDSYYVSPIGSGTACSLASPCSLTEGLSQAQAGDEVVLRDGFYYQGDIDLPNSGTSGAPIVIRGYTGETAVLDGADPASDTFFWAADGGGVYTTTVPVAGTHLVTANGDRLLPYDDLTDLRNLSRDNTPGFFASGTTLYVHLAGDADPTSATMVISRYGNAFTVEKDHIYFLDLTFRHYGQGDYRRAIHFDGASDNLVQGCTFASNDLGIGIKRASHRNVIQDNEFYDTIFDWPWADIKELGGLEDGGIAFPDRGTGRGNVIRRNTFHDDFDGFSVCPSTTAGMTNETDVYENLVYRTGDDGVETDGQCSNVRIWGNTFHDVHNGISLAPVYDGPVYAIRNLIYRIVVGNSGFDGTSFKFNGGYPGQSGPMYLFHNTADAALPGNNGLYIKPIGAWDLIYARNNIWAGTDYALDNRNTSQLVDLDYDDLWNGNSGDLVRWDSTKYATLTAFMAATGQEPHGLSVEPLFADAAGDDYTLDPTSDLIDAGVTIPGINYDYVGDRPDIGAYEFQGPGFTLAAAPSVRLVDPGGVVTYTLSLTALGRFTDTVNLLAPSPSPSLTLSLDPSALIPSGGATLTVTDTHTGTLPSGLWHTLPITATGAGITQTTSVKLLVGGVHIYLPLVVKE
jgi:parallel beta-helix repeat protein